MRAFLVFLLFIAYALGARWYYVCQVKNLCGNDRPTSLELVDDNGRVILQGYEEFAFDTTMVAPDLSEDNRAFLDEVAQYLKANPNLNLGITGLYRPSEKDRSSGLFENIGVARADRIRALLVRRGIDEERISLDYVQASMEALTRPLRFQVYTPETPSEFDRTAFTFTNMTFSDANFEYNSAAFNPGTQLQAYADSVKTFLEMNPASNLTIIGHTDSIGSDAYNDTLGLRRAENALSYFRQLGIENDIETETMGKRRPVAPNSTSTGKDNPEGRQKNRRVNFVIEE
jgi:outer membrane protein OmpA-like peptidoglycan-associated protein